MDVRTICLGILTRGDATGYEIKNLFEDDGYQHFVEASFGSIYPALNRLTEDGLVSVREEAQEKRPDRKVYSITRAGRTAFLASLLKPLPEDRHRSPFVFAMLFADLLPPERLIAMIDGYIVQAEAKLAQLNASHAKAKTPGEAFANGFGRTIYEAMLEYLRSQRGNFIRQTPSAAVAAE
ncbi:MAG: PadR family transcriptional regulator [Alphaproteobacteria bacterium]|nr:PadR family transcriptional regulator [Alphaproteobacteria bacterium]MBV9692430.1 PadR family transcriptional regulator [Alphaproteobacteria bacterium]